jgi:hypothetical protein
LSDGTTIRKASKMNGYLDAKIGELCRDGRPIFYTFLFGGSRYVESEDRDYLRRLHVRWTSRVWTGDYLSEIG